MSELALIAALDRNRAIGWQNRLPWSLPDDLKRFKSLTLGHTLLMGRKTAESLGRALPGRTNLVLSRSQFAPFPDMIVVTSIEAARARTDGTLFVIGGGELYAQTLPLACKLHLTHVDTELAEADTWFPAFDPNQWLVRELGTHSTDQRHAHGFRYVDYVRQPPR